ncbi:MAG TPA: hypothetical protein VLJ86_21785 [Ramlibacter sp.]|nr:hypothetical protein [Ramlibacter sp.]
MSQPPTLHACVISWPGHEDHSREIAARLLGAVDQLTVIYSTRDEQPLPQGAGEWVQVPDAWWYGRKHRECLRLHDCDILLQIQADAQCEDWAALAARCRQAHVASPSLGVWAPDIDNSDWPTDVSAIARASDGRMSFVAGTDCIVWSLSAPVAQRVRTLDYECTNLGWGVDLAAIAYAYTHDLQVVKDSTVSVHHPAGRRYDSQEAERQMNVFLAQLTAQEAVVCQLMRAYMNQRRVLLATTR